MIEKNPTHSREDQANDDQFVFQEGDYTWVLQSRCNGGPTHVTVASGANWYLPEVFAGALARYPHPTNLGYAFAALTIGRIRSLHSSYIDMDYGEPGSNAHAYTFTMEDALVSDNWRIVVQEFDSAAVIQSKSSLR